LYTAALKGVNAVFRTRSNMLVAIRNVAHHIGNTQYKAAAGAAVACPTPFQAALRHDRGGKAGERRSANI
jgi:hypothetical protein